VATMQDPFVVTASSSEGGDFERPAPGMYPAMLVAVIDLGTHTRVFSGESKKQRKVYLAWDLTEERDSKGQTFIIGQDYTFSLNVKAKFRALVEGWTGKTMAEGTQFNITELVGKPCLVNVAEGMSASGKKYSEISSVAQPMRGMKVVETERMPFVFSVTSLNSSLDDPAVPDWLPRIYGRTILDEIKASDEFGALAPI